MESKIRIVARWAIVIFAALQLLLLAGLSLKMVNVESFRPYVNIKWIQVWINLSLLVMVAVALDTVSKGTTLNSILEIYPESSSSDKRTACFFMLGFLYCVAKVISGGI